MSNPNAFVRQFLGAVNAASFWINDHALRASDVVNDSSVTGATVKDALNNINDPLASIISAVSTIDETFETRVAGRIAATAQATAGLKLMNPASTCRFKTGTVPGKWIITNSQLLYPVLGGTTVYFFDDVVPGTTTFSLSAYPLALSQTLRFEYFGVPATMPLPTNTVKATVTEGDDVSGHYWEITMLSTTSGILLTASDTRQWYVRGHTVGATQTVFWGDSNGNDNVQMLSTGAVSDTTQSGYRAMTVKNSLYTASNITSGTVFRVYFDECRLVSSSTFTSFATGSGDFKRAVITL